MGLSQAALGSRMAKWVEVPWTRQSVSIAELGKRAFGVDDLVGLSIGLGVSIGDLLTPAPHIDTVLLPSGTELDRAFVENDVIGTGLDGQETQRSRYIGRLEEIDAVSNTLAERKAILQQRIAELDRPEHSVVAPTRRLQDDTEKAQSVPTEARKEARSVPTEAWDEIDYS